jgi:hypothetical protein
MLRGEREFLFTPFAVLQRLLRHLDMNESKQAKAEQGLIRVQVENRAQVKPPRTLYFRRRIQLLIILGVVSLLTFLHLRWKTGSGELFVRKHKHRRFGLAAEKAFLLVSPRSLTSFGKKSDTDTHPALGPSQMLRMLLRCLVNMPENLTWPGLMET